MSANKEMMLSEAVAIARLVLDGKIEPNEGCSLIGEINSKLSWPDELAALGALAHDQSGHEHLGLFAKDCVEEIVEECRKLVEQNT